MVSEGRWVGAGWYEWTCRGTCGTVMTAKHPPQADEACCLSCRLEEQIGQVLRLARDVAADNARLRAENRQLVREAGELEDTIAELRDMVERAHTDEREVA